MNKTVDFIYQAFFLFGGLCGAVLLFRAAFSYKDQESETTLWYLMFTSFSMGVGLLVINSLFLTYGVIKR
ncbi:hypothetical protein OLK001_30980 [Synechocystis sp. LKSZ1]